MQFNGISAILHNLNWLEFGVKFVPMRMNEKKPLRSNWVCICARITNHCRYYYYYVLYDFHCECVRCKFSLIGDSRFLLLLHSCAAAKCGPFLMFQIELLPTHFNRWIDFITLRFVWFRSGSGIAIAQKCPHCRDSQEAIFFFSSLSIASFHWNRMHGVWHELFCANLACSLCARTLEKQRAGIWIAFCLRCWLARSISSFQSMIWK